MARAAGNSQVSHTCEKDRLTGEKILIYSLFVWRIVVVVLRGVQSFERPVASEVNYELRIAN